MSSKLEANCTGCNSAGIQSLGRPGSVERGLLPDPERYHCRRHVSAVCLSLSMNAKICMYEGDGKFSHKLHKVCISALYLNTVDVIDGMRSA